MTPTGRRPKGPKPNLGNRRQQELLDRLHLLNTPRRVTYEMLAKILAPSAEKPGVLRTLTRDLSRQFRGDKPIEARVVEVFLTLLYPDDPVRRNAEQGTCLALHALAFGAETGQGPAGPAAAEDDPHVDAAAAACIADLERQLAEARTRAALATALLAISHAEIQRLRGKHNSFDWFHHPPAAPPAPDPGGGAVTIPLRLSHLRGAARSRLSRRHHQATNIAGMPGRRGA